MMLISETEVFRACRVLFGSDLRLTRNFLHYLQPAGAHSAFRKKAKVTHPDSHQNALQENHRQVRIFQDLNQAHQLIQSFLRQRELLHARSSNTGTARSANPGFSAPPQPKSQPKTQYSAPQGPLPTRPLQLGLYLYYRGIIPFKTLAAGLIWQRQQRPAFGQIAQSWGWLKEDEIGQILACRKIGQFGERAEHLGLLSPLQSRAILLHQRTRQQKLGSYFVEKKILTSEQLTRLLEDLSNHNLKYRHGYPHHFYYHR